MNYSQCYKIYSLYFINWLNAGALLQLADAGGIGHMTRTIFLDYRTFFAISPKTLTQIVNLCLVFKTYEKSAVTYIKTISIKKVVSISPAWTTMLRAQTTTTRTEGKSLWTRFIVLMVPVFVFHGTGFSLLFWKFYKLLWSNVWFRFNKC